jgi:hypothetical protein
MIHCTHCGSTDGACDWVATDADPPCRAPYYDQAQLAREGWRIFKTLLSIEAGILTLAVLFALVRFTSLGE